MRIGILALQGAFREHRLMIEKCGHTACEIRKPAELDDIEGLIIPGGESTTIGKLLVEYGLIDKIKERAGQGMSIYGTCAGMILLAKDIVDSNQPRLGLMDITVKRNAFGRQLESFEADLAVAEFGSQPVKAVFIRAPYIEKAADNVTIMASVDNKIVIARQGKMLVSAFHPELTDDDRLHKYFIAMIKEQPR